MAESLQKRIEKIIRRYRNRIGINPSYIISTKLIPESKIPNKYKDLGAWIEEDDSYPEFKITFNRTWIQQKLLENPRLVTKLVVHELLHIIFGEILKDLKRNYNYDQDGKIEEKLVMQMALAIVPTK